MRFGHLPTTVPDDRDPITGLPTDVAEDLARAEQVLSVRVERRRYDKPVTVVEGFEPGTVDLADLASTLKKALGTGGTVKEGHVELQGDHRDRVPDLLREAGYAVEG